ncbi:MAG: hypothetical protein H6Q92_15 [Nitrospirae bacterium]|nr:hypothetical protein [Nitrospirota bacterium]
MVPFQAATALPHGDNFYDLWLSFPESIRTALPDDRKKRKFLCFETGYKKNTCLLKKSLKKLVPPAGIEPATPGLGRSSVGFHKCLEIPYKSLPVKCLQPFLFYMYL